MNTHSKIANRLVLLRSDGRELLIEHPRLALETVDNSAGAAGDLSAQCTWGVEIDLPNDGTHPVAQNDVGKPGYLSSSFAVSDTSADGPPVQYIVEYNQPYQISGRPVRVKI